MKTKLILTASAVFLLALPLVAANGFENFVLSRNDYKSTSSSAIANFSSRTRTVATATILRFNSGKPCGLTIIFR